MQLDKALVFHSESAHSPTGGATGLRASGFDKRPPPFLRDESARTSSFKPQGLDSARKPHHNTIFSAQPFKSVAALDSQMLQWPPIRNCSLQRGPRRNRKPDARRVKSGRSRYGLCIRQRGSSNGCSAMRYSQCAATARFISAAELRNASMTLASQQRSKSC